MSPRALNELKAEILTACEWAFVPYAKAGTATPMARERAIKDLVASELIAYNPDRKGYAITTFGTAALVRMKREKRMAHGLEVIAKLQSDAAKEGRYPADLEVVRDALQTAIDDRDMLQKELVLEKKKRVEKDD